MSVPFKSTEHPTAPILVVNEPLYRDTKRWKKRFPDSVTTTNATPTVIATIDELVDDSINEIVVEVAAVANGQSKLGAWRRTVSISMIGGVVAIRDVNADYDDQDSPLMAGDVTFVVNGTSVDVKGEGQTATTYIWSTNITYVQIGTNANP